MYDGNCLSNSGRSMGGASTGMRAAISTRLATAPVCETVRLARSGSSQRPSGASTSDACHCAKYSTLNSSTDIPPLR